MTNEEIIRIAEQGQADLMSDMLEDLIEGHRAHRGAKARELYERYKQENLPIQTRLTRNPNKIDERIPNDYFADIIDTKTGYMGNEVHVELQKERFLDEAGSTVPEYDEIGALIEDFSTLNNSEDQNSEAVKLASIAGECFRIIYIPEGRNEIRSMLIPAHEGIMIEDESLNETQYFIRYYYVSDHEYDTVTGKSQVTRRTVVEWYDHEMITYYIDDGRGHYVQDVSKFGGEQPHLFDGVPVVAFRNNSESQGEAEKVIDLIDAYDTVLSATVSEIEQLRLAYLKYRGGQAVDNDLLQLMEQTGILPLDADGDASFVTKELAIDAVKVMLDELRKNIYQFSRGIDLSKDYGGNIRVIGWQVALLNLENSCKVTERKFVRGLREQWRMIAEKWREWGMADLNYLDMRFVFTRNFPKDLAGEAKILLDLLGSVSRKTAYSQMSFIDDADSEIAAWEMEREMNMSLFGIDSGGDDGEPEDTTDEDE